MKGQLLDTRISVVTLLAGCVLWCQVPCRLELGTNLREVWSFTITILLSLFWHPNLMSTYHALTHIYHTINRFPNVKVQVDVCPSAKDAFSVIVKLQTSRRFVSSSTVDWHQTRVSCREQNKSRGPAGGGNKNADSIILEPQKSRSLNSAPFSILEQHRAWLFAPLISHRRFWLKKKIGKKFSHPRLIQPISISK